VTLPPKITRQGPWSGHHKGRRWSFDPDDLANVIRQIRARHPLRVILAGLDVVHADHPKAQQVRDLVTQLGETWPLL
jgi:hypothetical protein